MQKIKEKIIALSLTLALITSMLPGLSITASAATLPYGMTSSSIGVGSGSTLSSSTTQIGFGGQRWYVVGFNGTGINKGSEYVTLLAKGSMGSSLFSETGSTFYSGSNLQSFINNLPNSYDSREQALMVGLTLDEVSGTQPTNQKIWALGVTEASTISSSVLDLADGAWVLRTMSKYNTARTVSVGVVNDFGPPNTNSNCVRPGTALDLSKVLYAAPISGAKDTTMGMMNSVALSSEVKFTILDSSLGLTIASAPASLTKAQGSSISLNFSGAQTGDGKYVSCVLVSNSDSLVKYYAKLSASASGTLSIPISADIIAGSYKLLIYNEQICSGDSSDYASTPISIGITVTGASNTAPTLKSGVSSTDSASVPVNSAHTLKLSDIFTDIDGNTLTYRVYINGSNTAVPADENYSFTPVTAETTTLRFTAYDGAAESDSYTVTLTAGNVLATSITVTGENGATCIGKNGSLQLHYSFQPSNTTNQNVTWTVTMSTQAGEGSVDAANMLRTSGVVDPPWGTGKATIRATAQDGSGVFGELVLPVLQNIVTGITVSATNTDVAVGDTTQLSATVSPAEAKQDITWSISSGSDIASVSTTGLVTLTGSGTITVRATAQDGSGLFGEKTLTVKALQVAPSTPTMASKTATTVTLNAITGAEYSTDTYNWQSLTTFTDLEPNTAYSFYARMAGTDTMKFSPSSAALSVTTEKATLGGSVSITGTFQCGQSLNVNTSGMTADPSCSLGTISYQWTREGVNISEATGSTYSLVAADFGKVINVTVTTENCAGSISSSNAATTGKGDPDYIAPTGLKAAFGDTLGDVALPGGFAWEDPLDTSVGEIGDYSFNVKYTPDDTNSYNIITNISVTITVGKGNPKCTATPAASAITYGQTLADSTLSGGTASVPGSFAWTTETIAPSVSDSDTTEYSVTFTPTDTEHNNTITVSVKLKVNKATPSIVAAPTASAITYGQTLADSTLSGGVASVPGGFAWTTATTKPAVSDSNMTEYSVSFTPTDTANYNPTTTMVKLTVNKATPSIVATPAASAITYGQTLADSTLSGGVASVPGSFAWTTATTKPAVSDSNTTEYSVSFMPTDTANYNPMTTMVKLTVNKATPSIVATPAASAITYGQRLLDSTLSGGAADVEGSFAWTTETIEPSVSDSNTTEYSVTFTPTDSEHYNTITVSVKLTVNKAASSIITAPSASAITYGQMLSDSTLFGGTASVPGSFAWTNGTTIPSVSDSNTTTYSVTFTPIDSNYAPSTTTVTLAVNKAASSVAAPTNGTATDGDTNTFSFTMVSGYEMLPLYEYNADGTTWITLSSSNASLSGSTITISVGNIAGTVQVRVRESDNCAAGAALTSAAFTASVEGSVTIIGMAQYGQTLTANVTGAQSNAVFSYVWKAGGTQIASTSVNTLTLTMDNLIGKAITVEVSAPPYAGTLTSVDTAAVGKGIPTGTPSYTGISTSGKTLADAVLTIGSLKPETTGYTLKWVDDKGAELTGTTEVKTNTAYKWLFTPKDTANYDTLSGSITLYSVSTGGGVSGGGAATEKATVPVSTGKGNIEAAVTAKDGTAIIGITDTQMKEIVSGTESAGIVKIDVSGLKVDAAVLPATVVSALGAASGSTGLAVALPTGTVTLDKKVLGSIAGKGDIKISVDTVTNTALNDTQKAALGNQASTALVVDVNLYAGGTKTSTFGGGKISVSVPYTPKSGESTDNITVWFIKDDGTIEPKNGTYNASTGCVEFITEHLSQYLIVSFPFADVAEDSWYYGSAAYAYNNGLFSGTYATTFSPNTAMTRQMIWMVLARIDGNKPANMDEARAWAMEKGISDGFNPTDTITREQMATILYRYAALKKYDTTQNSKTILEFSDYNSISEFAQTPLTWAVSNGLMQGSNNNLTPQGYATRAQVAAILQRYCQNVAK